MSGHDEGGTAGRSQFDEIVALLSEAHTTAVPAAVRDSLMVAARTHPQNTPVIVAASPVDAYLRQVRSFADVAASVEGGQWALQAAPYGWSLHGLVAHLLQIERYFERTIGLADGPIEPDETDHLRMGAAAIDRELQRDAGLTLADWVAVTDRIGPSLKDLDLDRQVTFHQWPFPIGSLLVARSFELWTHADDLRRALAAPLEAPGSADIRLMSDVSVRSLPLAAHVVARSVPDGEVRMVLTGRGGGTWDLGLGAGGDRLVTVVADVVDYCRMASRRIAPSDLRIMVEGDASVAAMLLQAASIVSV
jgi:uncharacterized protein (TIGR03083 family)